MRFRLSPAWKLVMAVLSIIGIGGVPDDIQTWGEWLEMIDAWMEHGWVRVLVWAVSVIAFTYPQWYPGLRRRFAGWQRTRGRNAAAGAMESQSSAERIPPTASSPTAAEAQPSAPEAPRYTMQGPEEILEELKGISSLEAKQRVRVHLGLRMRVAGVVTDLDTYGVVTNLDTYRDDRITVHLKTDGGSSIFSDFNDDWEAQARTLRLGSRIAVDGEIRSVGAQVQFIVLEDARILPDREDA